MLRSLGWLRTVSSLSLRIEICRHVPPCLAHQCQLFEKVNIRLLSQFSRASEHVCNSKVPFWRNVWLCTQGQPCGSSSRLGLRTSLPPSTVPHGCFEFALWGAFLLQRDGGTEALEMGLRISVISVCRTEPSCMTQTLYFPTAWEALVLTVTLASRSQPCPSPAKRARLSSGGMKLEKRSHGIAMGLGLSQSSTEDTPGSVSPKIASPECADPRMAGSRSDRIL